MPTDAAGLPVTTSEPTPAPVEVVDNADTVESLTGLIGNLVNMQAVSNISVWVVLLAFLAVMGVKLTPTKKDDEALSRLWTMIVNKRKGGTQTDPEKRLLAVLESIVENTNAPATAQTVSVSAPVDVPLSDEASARIREVIRAELAKHKATSETPVTPSAFDPYAPTK